MERFNFNWPVEWFQMVGTLDEQVTGHLNGPEGFLSQWLSA